ncbi:MAG: sel1 repeat family protein [Synergistaceae bacterium]|nr:sel1 repeat family protein [Synergistaceae bacterium]
MDKGGFDLSALSKELKLWQLESADIDSLPFEDVKKLAERGNAKAQFNLGVMYQNGYGVKQDYGEAVKWYRLLAEQGNAMAQSNLGYMYENGNGVARDLQEARKWYEKAAAQGHTYAQDALKRLDGKR